MHEAPQIPTHQLVFTLNGQKHVLNIARDLTISLQHLDVSFSTHAGIRNHYAFLYRAVEYQLDSADDALEIWMAQERNAIRARELLLDRKKTEKSLDDEIKSKEEYKVKNQLIRNTRLVANKLRECVASLDERGKLLMKLGKKASEDEVTELAVRHRF